MKKLLVGIPAAALLLALTGCSASVESQALDLCVKSASDQLGGVSINRDQLKAVNMGDTLFDAGITDKHDADPKNAMITVAGKVTWTDGSTESRKTMVCTVKFENGEPKVNASLS